MYKSVELGRAVLSTSTTNLELWLKTLITVSPEQECTNLGQQLEQHTATSLLDRLSSGEVWVGCGNGLHIELMITFGGQPLADEQLRQLSECILVAPVRTLESSAICLTDRTLLGMGAAEAATLVTE
jgi:hypothetical protein